MYTAGKRRVREAEKRLERLEFKFITEYVKSLHGDIYRKAKELYQNARQLYPNVKDLTKTVEFMSTVTPHKVIPRYYTQRKANDTEKNSTREMVLEIPLLFPNKTTSTPVDTQPTQPSEETYQSAEVSQPTLPSEETYQSAEVSQPTLPSEETYQSAEVSQPTLPSEETYQPAEVSQPTLLSQETYEELLKELQQDPDLMQILNDFSIDTPPDDMDVFTYNDDDDGMNNDIWPSIIPDMVTQLEKELE